MVRGFIGLVGLVVLAGCTTTNPSYDPRDAEVDARGREAESEAESEAEGETVCGDGTCEGSELCLTCSKDCDCGGCDCFEINICLGNCSTENCRFQCLRGGCAAGQQAYSEVTTCLRDERQGGGTCANHCQETCAPTDPACPCVACLNDACGEPLDACARQSCGKDIVCE